MRGKRMTERRQKLRALAQADTARRCPVCWHVRLTGFWYPYCSEDCAITAKEREALR